MDRGVGAAARLPESDRKNLAVQALARSETVSDLAARHGVSRKFVYLQTRKVRAALDDAFSPATPDDEVLFELAVTKAWLRQVIVGLTLICRSSYRSVVEFLRDLLGLSISVGIAHSVLEAATRQACVINHDQDLSRIRVGLHDELFQGATPVLAGVDAASTYCYILTAEHHRDADTWGMHLLDATAERVVVTVVDRRIVVACRAPDALPPAILAHKGEALRIVYQARKLDQVGYSHDASSSREPVSYSRSCVRTSRPQPRTTAPTSPPRNPIRAIRVTPKTRNPFTIKALSIPGVTRKWHFLNHA